MSLELLAMHRTIMVVDVAGFTNPARTVAHQLAVHDGLYQVLHDAFAESGIPWESCTVEDRGDGAMILIPPDVPKGWIADRFASRIIAGLRRYNYVHSATALVQLRVGLHSGEVVQNAHGVVSQAVNFACRILDAPAAKAALRQSGEVVAFIASDAFYRDVICHDPAAHPDSYRRIPVAVKELSAEAWLRLAGGPVVTRPAPDGTLTGNVIPLHPTDQLEQLAGWLTDVTVDHLATVVRRAAGPSTPIPSTNNAWGVYLELTDINAGPDGLPPALVFLELLGEQVGGDLRAKISKWVHDQARRLRLEHALSERVAATSRILSSPRLHLLIGMEPHVINRNRCRFSYWRQDDPDVWPPTRGEVCDVDLNEVEYRVDEVVVDAERTWRDRHATVVLEFLLPRALMHLPVHNWSKEHESGNPRPLCLDYPIVLRSLERMRSRHWHRAWQDRWQTLIADPSVTRVHFGESADLNVPYRIDALLSDPRWVSMVLNEAPLAQPPSLAGTDELVAALRSGLPALFWHPHASPAELRDVVNWLLDGNGLADLAVRTQSARRALFLAAPAPININIVRDLVILCDDPRRLVDFDHPTHPSRRRGKPADER